MIRTESQAAQYLTDFTNGVHAATADVSAKFGGGGLGFGPFELLEAALATCMNMTLRMCAEKHAIPLSGASVSVSLSRKNPEVSLFQYSVTLPDSLSGDQRSRLLSALERCPVRMALSASVQFALRD